MCSRHKLGVGRLVHKTSTSYRVEKMNPDSLSGRRFSYYAVNFRNWSGHASSSSFCRQQRNCSGIATAARHARGWKLCMWISEANCREYFSVILLVQQFIFLTSLSSARTLMEPISWLIWSVDRSWTSSQDLRQGAEFIPHSDRLEL